jgi:hypothetical protein
MSAIVGVFSSKTVRFYTDTLSCYPKQSRDIDLKERSLVNKTLILPQFKSIIACTGTAQLLTNLYNYVIDYAVIGNDINALININTKSLINQLKYRWSVPLTGTLYIGGYNSLMNAFNLYALRFGNLGCEIKQMEECVFIKPTLDFNELPEFSTYDEYAIHCIQKLKDEDSSKALIDKVGIGGEIQFTGIALDQTMNFIILLLLSTNLLILNRQQTILNLTHININ